MLKYCYCKANKHNQISNKLLLFTEKSNHKSLLIMVIKFNNFCSSLLDAL